MLSARGLALTSAEENTGLALFVLCICRPLTL